MTAAGNLWAITSYFNPVKYVRRKMNYDFFRQHLGVPLIAVELCSDGRFELAESDADLLIRRHGRDVMWHKERLMNIALDALPADCGRVAWSDCDMVLEQP